MKFKQFGLWLLVGASILALYLISGYMTFTYTISAQGIIYPQQEWELAHTADGNLIQSLKNHYDNTTSSYSVTEFQRGDLASFTLLEDIFLREHIAQGDTIARLHSLTEMGRLVELEGELERQHRLLAFYASGEKPQQVQVAREIMQRAQTGYETQKAINQRNRELFERRHIAREEFEISENNYLIAYQNLAIARSEYEAITSGAKPEQLDLIKAAIHTLEAQIEHLQQLMASFTIYSPISGTLLRKQELLSSSNAILRVADVSAYIILIPIEIYQLEFLKKGQEVEIVLPHMGHNTTAIIYDFDNSVQMLNQRQHIFVRALVEPESASGLFPFMRVDANIKSDAVSLMEYIRRFSNEVYNN